VHLASLPRGVDAAPPDIHDDRASEREV